MNKKRVLVETALNVLDSPLVIGTFNSAEEAEKIIPDRLDKWMTFLTTKWKSSADYTMDKENWRIVDVNDEPEVYIEICEFVDFY